ncbi:hypothetical protein F5B19DRAFT_117151 [Rostrohypoxylon terebratum]|nr:hypothetical protein F5B19DRAFT_117151 [Rostrohypoxylon terebratum]
MPTLPPGLILRPADPMRRGPGRSVLTRRAFAAGDTIAEFSDSGAPTVAIPDSARLSQTCSHCLKPSAHLLNTLHFPHGTGVPRGAVPKLHACTGCRMSWYCGVACQRADWKLVHGKGECKAFKESCEHAAKTGTPPEVPTPVRALLQVLLRPEMRAAVFEMEGHEDEERVAPGTRPFEMALQVRVAVEWAGLELNNKNLSMGMDATCKLQVNSFSRRDDDFGQGGMYVNAALAMVNHSCIPNAYVAFTGRKAILHAYRDIKEGEEVTISYTEHDRQRSLRQHHLKTHYYFKCKCLRCTEDLDVYQVCQMYPNLELNASDPFSLVRDVDKLRNPTVKYFLNSDKSIQRHLKKITPTCIGDFQTLGDAAMRKEVHQRLKLCLQLLKADLFAVEPLNTVFGYVTVYFAKPNTLAYAFAIACFQALYCDPYISPAPFTATRVKGMFMIVKLLTMGPLSAKGKGELATKLSQFSSKVDQPTMCQMLLIAVIHFCPLAKSDEWQLCYQAQDLLDDLKSLKGRDKENALVDAFVKNPNGQEEQRFFNTVVREPIQEAAGFASEILFTEFGD